MVCLTISGMVYKRHCDGPINAKKPLVGLEHLVRHSLCPFIIIWDLSRTHKAKIVKVFLEKYPEIHVEYLPAYAPECNPGEYCHGNVKRRMKISFCIRKLTFAVLWIQVSPEYVNVQISCSPVVIMQV